jgi:hypothetical protein
MKLPSSEGFLETVFTVNDKRAHFFQFFKKWYYLSLQKHMNYFGEEQISLSLHREFT